MEIDPSAAERPLCASAAYRDAEAHASWRFFEYFEPLSTEDLRPVRDAKCPNSKL
jgi:hypothetical protein